MSDSSDTSNSDTTSSTTTSVSSDNKDSERLAFLKLVLEQSKHNNELAELGELREVLEEKHQFFGYVVSFSV
jgi:hypothetical protein